MAHRHVPNRLRRTARLGGDAIGGAGVQSGDSIEVQFFDARAGAKVTKVVSGRPEAGEETS